MRISARFLLLALFFGLTPSCGSSNGDGFMQVAPPASPSGQGGAMAPAPGNNGGGPQTPEPGTNGGTPGVGMNTGGTVGAGGSAPQGGSTSQPNGGTAAGGAPVDTQDPLAPTPSSGCGQALPAGQAVGGYTEYTLTPAQVAAACRLSPPGACAAAAALNVPVDGFGAPRTDRQYFVRLPNDYDPARMYQVVFIAMGCVDLAVNLATPRGEKAYHFYEPDTVDEPDLVDDADLIQVALQFVGEGGQAGNPCYYDMILDSPDFPYIEAVHQLVESQFCFDTKRVAFTGYSSGGWLANSVGCLFSGPDGFVRTQAVYTGGEPEYLTSNEIECVDQPMAAIFSHDELDGENPISGNIVARNRLLISNGCAGAETEQNLVTPTLPTEPYPLSFNPLLLGVPPAANQCVRYTGCPAEYPVVWCVTQNVQHSSSNDSFVVPAFWTFISGL